MTPPTWTSPAVVRAWLARRWEQGIILATVAAPSELFPLRVPLKTPTRRELAERFDEARAWVAAIRAMPRLRVELQRVNHRQLGAQDVPWQVWVDTPDDAAAILGKSSELQRFRELVEHTTLVLPDALALLAKRPLDALEAADDWATMLTVAQWVLDHPRPDVYVRQIDLAGVHTKFVEQHRQLLTSLLNQLLRDDAVDTTARPGDFNRRFGFRHKPRVVRFRSLDPALRLTTFDIDGEYLLTAADFARLPLPQRVFITENEINFVAFPDVQGAIAVFGAGSGLEHLGQASWLASCPVHYWGDIDTHGFWILDQLRTVVPHAESLLMNRDTLMKHQPFWGTEQSPFRRDLCRLTPAENELFDDLRDNRIAPNLRLEQERIRFGEVQRAIEAITNSPTAPA